MCQLLPNFYMVLFLLFKFLSFSLTAYIMYEVNYNGRTLYVSNYFHCRIHQEELLYDTEHDLLAIAEFLLFLYLKLSAVSDFLHKSGIIYRDLKVYTLYLKKHANFGKL